MLAVVGADIWWDAVAVFVDTDTDFVDASGSDRLRRRAPAWYNKLTRDTLNDAREQADGDECVLVDEEGRYYPDQVENGYRFLLPALIATVMVRKLMLACAKAGINKPGATAMTVQVDEA